jgi:AraC family transcriptional regulator, transcriptional activator of pobA
MLDTKLFRATSIAEYHRYLGLSKPEHPYISVINLNNVPHKLQENPIHVIFDFYFISLKRLKGVQYKYGGQLYDSFEDDGVLFFMSPGQLLSIEIVNKSMAEKRSGWLLLFHPDFIWNTSLAKDIRRYEFFDYSVNEALFLSEKEEKILNSIIDNIQHEYHSNIDKFSKKIIVTHIENLLSYSERFYNRQFITREKVNHQMLSRLEDLLNDYFNDGDLISKGLPSVEYISGQLNISSKYLSTMLKTLTGQNTQQHIHEKLINKAKEKLATTNLSVSEIAYNLGFEHPQSFSKLFKSKNGISPLAFRQSLN